MKNRILCLLPPSLPLSPSPCLTHFHDVSGEIHGYQVVVEEEILRYSLKTVPREIGF